MSQAITNETSGYHYAAVKILKSATNNVTDCLTEIEINKYQTNFSSEKLKFLKETQSKLNSLINEISRLNDLTSETQVCANTSKSNNETSNSNYLNDWILSDFNLLSYDFNNELSILTGKLFDLSFNFKFVKTISNKCFLMKFRHQTNSTTSVTKKQSEFLLKRLQKSFNPNLSIKSIVPYGNRIPFMSQLIKYYESDSTIFILTEYYPLGKLYPNLGYLYDEPDNFLKNLNSPRTLKKQDSTDSFKSNSSARRRNSISGIRLNYSFSCVMPSKETPKRRTQSEMADTVTTQKIQINPTEVLSQLTEVELDNLKISDDLVNGDSSLFLSSSTLESSSSSESDAEESNIQDKVEFVSQDKEVETTNKSKWSLNSFKLKIDRKLSPPIALFKTSKQSAEDAKNTPILPPTKKECLSSEEEPNSIRKSYFKQIKLWLAQIICALKNLHEIGILCKDLHADNLLIAQNGHVVLTYFSKWNLVDEKLSLDAIENFYVAPGESFYL